MVWVALKRVIWISIGNAIGLLFSIVLILEYRTIRGIISLLYLQPYCFVSFYFMNKEIMFFKSISLLISDYKKICLPILLWHWFHPF
jgi:PST family polysaccharide transporter